MTVVEEFSRRLDAHLARAPRLVEAVIRAASEMGPEVHCVDVVMRADGKLETRVFHEAESEAG